MLNKIRFYFIRKKALSHIQKIDEKIKYNLQRSRIEYHYSYIKDNAELEKQRESVYEYLKFKEKELVI